MLSCMVVIILLIVAGTPFVVLLRHTDFLKWNFSYKYE